MNFFLKLTVFFCSLIEKMCRLRNTEESIQHCRNETKDYSNAVAAMEISVIENVEMMSKNMKVLDEKMNSLAGDH